MNFISFVTILTLRHEYLVSSYSLSSPLLLEVIHHAVTRSICFPNIREPPVLSIYRYESFIDVKAINVYLWSPCQGSRRRRMPTSTFKRVAQLCEGSKIYYRMIWIILSFLWIGKWINPLGTSAYNEGEKQKYCFGAPQSHSVGFTAWSAPISQDDFNSFTNLLNLPHPQSSLVLPFQTGNISRVSFWTFWLGWLNEMKQILNYPRLWRESLPLRVDPVVD